jgi:hypothetical protein
MAFAQRLRRFEHGIQVIKHLLDVEGAPLLARLWLPSDAVGDHAGSVSSPDYL